MLCLSGLELYSRWVPLFVHIRSLGLDRVVVKLFFIRGIGLQEAEQGKVNGAFME